MAEGLPTDAVEAAAKAMNDEGAGPGNSIHSWRCEYPAAGEGPCDCVQQVAEAALAAAVPLLEAQLREKIADEIRAEMKPVDYGESDGVLMMRMVRETALQRAEKIARGES